MADIVNISGTRISRPGDRTDSFRDGRKSRPVIEAAREAGASAFWRAVERLERILASGEVLRHDVPRGYYLNILV